MDVRRQIVNGSVDPIDRELCLRRLHQKRCEAARHHSVLTLAYRGWEVHNAPAFALKDPS